MILRDIQKEILDKIKEIQEEVEEKFCDLQNFLEADLTPIFQSFSYTTY